MSIENTVVAKNASSRCQVTWVWILVSAFTRHMTLDSDFSFFLKGNSNTYLILLLSVYHPTVTVFLLGLGSVGGLTLQKWLNLKDQYLCEKCSWDFSFTAPVIFPNAKQLSPYPYETHKLTRYCSSRKAVGPGPPFNCVSWPGPVFLTIHSNSIYFLII